MTARARLTANVRAVDAAMDRIKAALADLEARRHVDWGHAGNAGRVLELLEEAARFIAPEGEQARRST